METEKDKIYSLLTSNDERNKILGLDLLQSVLGLTETDAEAKLCDANQDNICERCLDMFFEHKGINFLCYGSRCQDSMEIFIQELKESVI